MRLLNILLFLFLLSAFSVGISLSDENDFKKIDSSIDSVSESIENFTLTRQVPNSSLSNIDMNGFYLIIEKYIQFVGTFSIEIMRAGIKFGYDNPSYFTADNILHIIKLIIWLIIISLLIRPLGYVIIFIILGLMWIKDRLRKNATQRLPKTAP